ncbi:MAG: hypothetical protein AAFN74_19095, partial [Myxococcota bacterium]
QDFGVQITYRTGYAEAATWAAGKRQRTVYLGNISPGDYTVALTPEWSSGSNSPTAFFVAMHSQVFLASHAIMIGIVLWLLPLIQLIRYFMFEKARWAESDNALS